MLDGFGLAPVCLEINLDSYEGPWTHVHRFRGRSGWLVVAEARVVSESTSWETTLVAACDEWGEAVPSHMAPNLLACACSLPEPCDELPPDELDLILEEEEGALLSRWLRETDRELGALAEGAERQIDTLEATTQAYVDTGERQISELRRRRRMGGADAAAREMLDAIILDIEAENDVAMERLASRRAELRNEAERAEERLLSRIKAHVEGTPLYYVNWRACAEPGEAHAVAAAVLRERPVSQHGLVFPVAPPGSCAPAPCSSLLERRIEEEIGRLEMRAVAIQEALARRWELSGFRVLALRREAKAVQAGLKAGRSSRADWIKTVKGKK